jgi:hypothetical protein
MDPVEVRETRTGTGRTEVLPEEVPVATAQTQRMSYAETRVVNPSWRRISQLIWLVVGVMNVILAFDFLFRALGAKDTGFATFIYSLGNGLAAPFDGIFGNTVNNAGNGTIGIDRWADLMAIAIYSLVAAGVVKLVRITTTPKDSVASSSSTTLV